MTKTKSQKRIFMLLAALLVLSSTSFAAKYDWTGAVDFDWITPGNWDVSGSTWTWPNQEYGDSRVNQDCDKINITTGDTVNRNGELVINGAPDGSNESVLTIDNGSGLNNSWDMWIGREENSRGQVEVRDGSLLTVGGKIEIGHRNASVGTLNIIDGTVDIGDGLTLGTWNTAAGTVEINRGILNMGGGLMVGFFGTPSIGKLEANNSTLNIGSGMTIGYYWSTGTVKIKSSVVDIGGTLAIAKHGAGVTGILEIKKGDNPSTFTVGNNLLVGYRRNSTGTVEINSSFMEVGNNVILGQIEEASGALEIKDGTLVIGGSATIGQSGNTLGTLDIKDSTVEIGDKLVLARDGTSTGTLEIKGGTLDIGNDLILVSRGASATLNIKGNSIINIGDEFQMNAKSTGKISEVVMDDGVVTVLYDSYINLKGDGDSIADFTLNDGIWDSGGNINVGKTDEGDSYLTINGGMMQAGQKIFVGRPGGDDFGQSRIFLNGGLLQGEGLEFNMDADTLIVYRGGELWINNSALSEAGMQGFIDSGKIDVPPDYEITTIGTYTVLRS